MSLRPLPLTPAAGASDAELLEAVAGGSDIAFEELRSRYRRAIDRICKMLRRDADDCAQEAFVRIWQKARLFDPARGSASTWMLTVARSVAFNLGSKRVPEPRAEPRVAAEPAPDQVDALWVRAALAQLAEREREVIELAYFADLSQTQIADRLGIPLGTVKSWMRRGLNKLADVLEDDVQ